MILMIQKDSEINVIKKLITIVEKQLKFIGKNSSFENIEQAIKNALKSNRALFWVKVNETGDFCAFVFGNICSGLETGAELYFNDSVRRDIMTKPHGQLVKIKGRNMHIRQMGAGNITIILLPGHNLPLPSVELAPLMRDLSKKHTVCIVEFFGYGHSDPIDSPRTNENYVQELREGLAKAEINPPYLLMPYSASGIYAEYYSSKYPEEIEGLILLDATPSVETVAQEWSYTNDEIEEDKLEIESFIPPSEDDIKKAIEASLADYIQDGYTKEEVIEIYTTPNHKHTILAQDIAYSSNIHEVMNLLIPKDIPILAFYSSLERIGNDEKFKWAKRRKEHIDRLGERVKFMIIEGSTHGDISCHPDYRKIICKEIDEFLKWTK